MFAGSALTYASLSVAGADNNMETAHSILQRFFSPVGECKNISVFQYFAFFVVTQIFAQFAYVHWHMTFN